MSNGEDVQSSIFTRKTADTALPLVLKMVAADPLLQRGGLELISDHGQAECKAEEGQKILNEEGEHAYWDWWHAEQCG